MAESYEDPGFADELGRTIRLLRIDRRIDRRDLAEQAGISYSYLSAMENGSKTPSARLLYSLARALGLRDDELLGTVRERLAADPPAPSQPAPPAAAAPLAISAAPPPSAPSQSGPGRRGFIGRRQPVRDSGGARSEVQQELAAVVERLDPEDAEAVLDLARRLAGR